MVKVKFRAWFLRLAFFLGLAILLEANGLAASVNPRALPPHSKTRGVTENQHAKKRMRTLARSRVPALAVCSHACCRHHVLPEHAIPLASRPLLRAFSHQFVRIRYYGW